AADRGDRPKTGLFNKRGDGPGDALHPSIAGGGISAVYRTARPRSEAQRPPKGHFHLCSKPRRLRLSHWASRSVRTTPPLGGYLRLHHPLSRNASVFVGILPSWAGFPDYLRSDSPKFCINLLLGSPEYCYREIINGSGANLKIPLQVASLR
ncbi:MAG: hypothetical protein ACTSRL_03210, partial [Candidatus Helarchaeota archaeon]